MASKPEPLGYNARREFEFVGEDNAGDPKKIFDVTESDNIEASTIMHSIEYLKPEDIEPACEKPKKSAADKVFDAVRNVVYFASIGVFAVCLFLLAQNIIDKIRGEEYYDNMASDFGAQELMLSLNGTETEPVNAASDPTVETGASVLTVKTASQSKQSSTSQNFSAALESSGALTGSSGGNGEAAAVESTYNAALEKMKAKLNQYRLVNPDTYGYIYIEGTKINYVLVQSDDNDFYLDHDYEGNPLRIGAIFVDFRNYASILKNFNTVTYGHNITSGLMYHDVTLFTDPEIFANKLIYVYTFDGAYVYKPFAIYQSSASYQYFRTSFASAEAFVDFAYELKAKSLIQNDTEFTTTDRIITLSTCFNSLPSDQRWVLQCKLVQIIK